MPLPRCWCAWRKPSTHRPPAVSFLCHLLSALAPCSAAPADSLSAFTTPQTAFRVPAKVRFVSVADIVSVSRACNACSTGVQRAFHERATRVPRPCNAGFLLCSNGNECFRNGCWPSAYVALPPSLRLMALAEALFSTRIIRTIREIRVQTPSRFMRPYSSHSA